MEFVDTHCHIHGKDYGVDPDKALSAARGMGVTHIVCVGTDVEDSHQVIEFVSKREGCFAAIGIHPHEAKRYIGKKQELEEFSKLAEKAKVVAVGECGLDYYYHHSPKNDQEVLLRLQIELALKHDLPLIFHVRHAFEDFWRIVGEYPKVRGVIHSFTAHLKELDEALARGFYIGLNGIMTFTKDEQQLAAARQVPLERLVLETDAPFLTPIPYRGKICEPKHVVVTAEFLAQLRSESLAQLAAATTKNAADLFRL